VSARAQEFGIDATRLGVCGDSAGGTLAAICCQLLARRGSAGDADLRLALQLLLCPILDYSRLTRSRLSLSKGYLVDEATLEHDLLHYLPEGFDPADPRISPARAHYERIQETGAIAVYHCHPGMIHLFYGLGRMIPYAAAAIERIGDDIRAALANRPVLAARMLAS
jgi:acetyl esterase/lipase